MNDRERIERATALYLALEDCAREEYERNPRLSLALDVIEQTISSALNVAYPTTEQLVNSLKQNLVEAGCKPRLFDRFRVWIRPWWWV